MLFVQEGHWGQNWLLGPRSASQRHSLQVQVSGNRSSHLLCPMF